LKLWSLALVEYDFDIIYRPGKFNELADWLSRDSTSTSAPKEETIEIPEVTIPNPFRQTSTILPVLFNHIANLHEVQLAHLNCQKLFSSLHQQDPQTTKRCAIGNNIIVNRQNAYNRPYIPKTLVPTILSEFHDSPSIGGHSGFSKTMHKIRNRFF